MSAEMILSQASDGGLRTTALFGFFERWEAVRDENWNSGDYTKQSLGSRTDTMLKELREVMAAPLAGATVETEVEL